MAFSKPQPKPLPTIRESLEEQRAIEASIKTMGVQTFLRSTNYMKIKLPTKPFLVDRFIPAGEVGMIMGSSAGGKTSVTTSIALAVANGALCFGNRKTVKRPVLVIDKENPLHTTQERTRRLGKGLDYGNIFWWGNFPGYKKRPPALNDEFLLEVIDYYDEPPLIIVDSFVTCLPKGANENDSLACAEVIDQARNLTINGASVLFIHHTGKGEDKKSRQTAMSESIDVHAGRGSSAIGGAVDYSYFLRSKVVSNTIDWAVLTCAKLRVKTQDYKINLDCNPPDGTFTDVYPEPELKPAKEVIDTLKMSQATNKILEREELVLGLIRENSGRFNTSELLERIASDLDITGRPARAMVGRMKDKNQIHVTKGERNSDVFHFGPLPIPNMQLA